MAAKKRENRFDFTSFKYLNDNTKIVYEKTKKEDILTSARDYFVDVNDTTKKTPDGKFQTRDYNYDYYLNLFNDAINAGKTVDDVSRWVRESALEMMLKQHPEWQEEVEKKFLEWYDATPAAQEVYKHCAAEQRYWYHNHKNITEEDARKLNFIDRPFNLSMFDSVALSWKGREYMEKNREEVFQEGDLVVLRQPFIGHWRHDPHYKTDGMKPEDKRYGTVMKANDGKVSNRGRNGKGTRLVSIMWFGKDGLIDNVEEKRIKFESRKRDH